MRLGSVLLDGRPVLVALVGEELLNLSAVTERFYDVSEVLTAPDGLDVVAELLSAERGTLIKESDVIWRPLTPRPGKVICLGLTMRITPRRARTIVRTTRCSSLDSRRA